MLDRFSGLFGIVLILGIAFLISNDRKAINYRLVASGLGLQFLLAIFILKVPLGQLIFAKIGRVITKLLAFSDMGRSLCSGRSSKRS